MIGKPNHDKRFGISTASLTTARPAQLPRYNVQREALDPISDDLERILLESGYLNGAPFWWVDLFIRFGLKDDEQPQYQRINKKYGDLPLAIEVDTHRILEAADRDGLKPIYNVAELTRIFKVASLKALIHAGAKYDRPTKALEDELARTVM
ncbi:MAG: Imm39 family immunity protein [Planctomycetota bacterium]